MQQGGAELSRRTTRRFYAGAARWYGGAVLLDLASAWAQVSLPEPLLS